MQRPRYARTWLIFFRNSLLREMRFRANFLITLITRAFYFVAQIVLFEIIYRNIQEIEGWDRNEYFAFLATVMLINALVETFFMPNCAKFSELIRTGELDFALLKPIDTQFLISFERVEIAMFGQVALAIGLLVLSLSNVEGWLLMSAGERLIHCALYLFLVLCGAAFFYSLMVILAATSIWFGRNQGLYDFWFYVTVFARYPRDIYTGQSFASAFIAETFTYVIPILLVVTVPARTLVSQTIENWSFVGICFLAAVISLLVARAVFNWSLRGYRSASS